MKKEEQKKKQQKTAAETAAAAAQTQSLPELPETPELERLPETDISQEREQLEAMSEAALAQAQGDIDRAVEEGVQALQRAEEDAQPGFQTMRDQIDSAERMALDEQALYAEMRGDRGGVGQAQYASVQNTAAVNRRQVAAEQQRLATETARQIEELRRQGEFRKADAVLTLRQKQLTELMELERWAKEQNLSIAEFNTELARWEAEYAWQLSRFGIETELSLAQLSGTMPDGSPTLAARQAERSRLAEAAKTLLELGLTLTDEQLEALGWTEGQYEDYVTQREQQAAAAAAQGAQTQETGDGIPEQLFGNWTTLLRSTGDPARAWAMIQGTDYFPQMSEGQRRALERIVRDRGAA